MLKLSKNPARLTESFGAMERALFPDGSPRAGQETGQEGLYTVENNQAEKVILFKNTRFSLEDLILIARREFCEAGLDQLEIVNDQGFSIRHEDKEVSYKGGKQTIMELVNSARDDFAGHVFNGLEININKDDFFIKRKASADR